MHRSNAEDRKLSEVKAVLQRLQRFSAEPTSIDPPAEGGTAHATGDAKRRLAIVAALAAAAALTGILVASYTFVAVKQPKDPAPKLIPAPPVKSTTPEAAPPAAALQAAMALMTSGRIRAARAELLRLAPQDSVDAAWALARSFDPNYLTTVPGADAGPDIAEATRWYRTWYAISVKQGLVADSVSLDRIIRSMR